MDEVRMVRDFYPEPAPPTAREVARAKALLNKPPRRSLPRLRWGLGGVVAAGAAATVAITLVGGNTSGGGNTPTPLRTVNLGPKGAILAAAEKAEQQPTGNYWYTDIVAGQSYIMRPKTGTYAITGAADESFHWTGAKPGMGEVYHGRDLPAHPLTKQDAALWRKAGSPSSFRVWSNDHYYTYAAKGTKWSANGPERGIDPRGGGDFLGKSVKDLQNLPTDHAKLAAMFLSETEMSKALGQAGKKLSPEMEQRLRQAEPYLKISRVAGILGQSPVPPKVRAGLMRALATQPGIHAIGRDTDPLGRPGVALASDERTVTVTGEYGGPKAEQGTYRYRAVIIFDERTGAVLSRQNELTRPGGPYAEMKPGFIIEYQAVRSTNWTGTKPKPSAELPSFG
ncbi:CU044_5270 family protein [Actinoallomurus purpureus]|uniref:CU044_5270 family protein n=1 Tax=Actinoallomurus purpureus TaxID=478114 RepID=UPI002093FBCB|nr:CU044_5270 family protein [Actinoallomurus purpureus]MCO6003961.1 CU044_5270 family protein [Actinoallomurus purpureus]